MSKLIFQRGMTLVSLLTCIAALALLLAALSTQHWVVGRAHRKTNSNLSDGRIQFGLFYGTKNLNFGYGYRTYEINVVQLMADDKTFMSYGLWITTLTSICFAILFAVFSAIFALVNTATTPVEMLTGIPGLYLWNTLGLLCNLLGVITWSIQYHLRLRHNILSIEDIENLWGSDGLAVLGFSFWFVVGAAIIHILNLVLIFFGSQHSHRDRHNSLKPIIEEKGNGAIMLY